MANMIQCHYKKCRMRVSVYQALYHAPLGKYFCNTSCLTFHLNDGFVSKPPVNVLQKIPALNVFVKPADSLP